jgi:hypothetical protein
MNDDLIPEELRRFILLHIDSVAELECLILFHRNPGWVADSEAVAGKLYISEEEMKRKAARSSIISPSGAFWSPRERKTVFTATSRPRPDCPRRLHNWLRPMRNILCL